MLVVWGLLLAQISPQSLSFSLPKQEWETFYHELTQKIEEAPLSPQANQARVLKTLVAMSSLEAIYMIKPLLLASPSPMVFAYVGEKSEEIDEEEVKWARRAMKGIKEFLTMKPGEVPQVRVEGGKEIGEVGLLIAKLGIGRVRFEEIDKLKEKLVGCFFISMLAEVLNLWGREKECLKKGVWEGKLQYRKLLRLFRRFVKMLRVSIETDLEGEEPIFSEKDLEEIRALEEALKEVRIL